MLWEQGGEESKAAEHFVISAKLNPQNGTAFRYLGDFYARVSADFQRALKCYHRAVILNPDDSLAGEPFCDLLDQQGKLTLQFSVCSEASDKSPRAFWAFRRLGFLLVLSLTPHFFVLPSSFFLVRCLHFLFVFFHFQVHQKKWSEAVHRLQHAIRGYPTCADLWEVFLIYCYSFQFNLLLCYINLTLTYLKQFEFVVLFVFCWSRPWDLPISGWACLLPH